MACKNGENLLFLPPKHLQSEAHVNSFHEYQELYNESINYPEKFWSRISSEFYWETSPTKCFGDYNFDIKNGQIFVKWFENARTNICYNVLDRNVKKGFGDKIAFYWEGNDPGDDKQITYSKLLDEVCKFSNVLKSLGVRAGDRVAIYMPMILELTIAMLACARIGAIHSVVFAGFSSESLADRILDARCSIVLTADGVWRGIKLLNLKGIVDRALSICEARNYKINKCVVVCHVGKVHETQSGTSNMASTQPLDIGFVAKHQTSLLKVTLHENQDVWWHDLMATADRCCEPEWMAAEDPLFLLYTSGSTGKPKGVLHTVAGYMVFAATTFKYSFDYQMDDVYWCTADVGWITGHSYLVYGPLANGATSVMFEGMPFYPDAGRLWSVVEKYKVTKFYTAPTAIRALMKYGNKYVTRYDRGSLKVLGTVGELINPEAWLWYYTVVGDSRCAIVDTFWQTETGGHMIAPLPGATPTKPGSATFPFFGILPAILNDDGQEIEGIGEGSLVFKRPWPGILRTVFGSHERFEATYFTKFPGYFCTGDGAMRDKDGYLWVTGRIDDMLNVSGHLLSTAEVESALIEHPSVSEAASVSNIHSIKGECIYCFVTLNEGEEFTDLLVKELKDAVRAKIGPFAQPDVIQNAPALPKTRSGKIMRRILRKIARRDDDYGDTSTLAEEGVIEQLCQFRPSDA